MILPLKYLPSPKQLAAQKLNKRWGLCIQKETTTDYSSKDLLSIPLSLLKLLASTVSYGTKFHSVTKLRKEPPPCTYFLSAIPIYLMAPFSHIGTDNKQ